MKMHFCKKVKNSFRQFLTYCLAVVCEKTTLGEEYFIENYNEKFPKVKTIQQTIDELINTNKSIARFGDGELELMEGRNIPFQRQLKEGELSKMLKNVLSSSNDNFLLAIPRFIYTNKDNLQDVPKEFWRKNGKRFRDTIAKYINQDKTYWAAEFTIAFSAYREYDVAKYFEDLQKIWNNKDITIICVKTVFNDIKYNIFDNAKSVEYLYAPSVNAFDKYDEILESSLSIDKDRLIICILGPTAKVLAYDLFCRGYRSLDLGHIAKSYDWYKKQKTTLSLKDAIDFF